MPEAASSNARLTKFYGELSSLEAIMAGLSAAGVDADRLQARDLYTRDLDCHNLGMHAMLDLLAAVAGEYGKPSADDSLLDLGCGLGGPGRFLVDQYGCSVVGVDVLPLRIDIAQTLTDKTGLTRPYLLPRGRRNRPGLRGPILRPGLDARRQHAHPGQTRAVQRDRTRPRTRRPARHARTDRTDTQGNAPSHAPRPLHRAITPAAHPLRRRTRPPHAHLARHHRRRTATTSSDYAPCSRRRPNPSPNARAPRQDGFGLAMLDGYIETLAHLGGRTGILVARRMTPNRRSVRWQQTTRS